MRAGGSSVLPAVRAIAWRTRAETLLFKGEYKAARSAYERACSLAASAGEPALLGQILVGRIGTLLVMGEFRNIQSMARQAEALLRRSEDQDYLRRLHINLASGHYHRERYADAYASFLGALRLMEKTGQRDDVWANLQLNHGTACIQLTRVQEARVALKQAEAYGRAHGQDRLVAQAELNQAVLEGLRGSYRVALRLLAEAEETFARQEVRELLAATRLEQAQIYLDLSMPAEARELASMAASSFLAEGMLLDGNLSNLTEARGLLLLGRPLEAIESLALVERFFRARRIPGRRARVLLDLAQAMAARGELLQAMRTAGQGLRVADRLGLKSLVCAGRCMRAELLLRLGDAPRAERTLRGVEALLRRLPMHDRLEYWSTAARVARAAGRTTLAERRYRQAARFLEAQRALIPGVELRARSFERDVRIYHEKIALLASSPGVRVDRVMELMERARGRTFRELVAMRGQAGHEEIAEKRAVLGSMVRRLDHLLMGAPSKPSYEAEHLRRQILQLERQITSRVRRLESIKSSAAGTAAFRSVREIQPLLAPGELLVDYFVTEDRILAAVVSTERRVLRSLEATASGVRAKLDHLRLQLESLAVTADRPLGGEAFLKRSAEVKLRDLFDLLLRPLVRDFPSGGRLTIVPHDILHQVPFECLHDGEGYVDRSWRVTRCPTADFLIERRSRPKPATSGRAVVIAGTRVGSPFIAQEAHRVAECLQVAAGDLLLDPGSEQALAAMREALTIHVSAHGTFRADNPLFSTLHLGPGVLFLADILETPLVADLVVLSACNSGQTFSGRGDALLGVAHAFLAAGAQRLVASLWRVHDEATARWMEIYHRAYRTQLDPSAAHRAALQALREEWPHPFYWGGFCVLGA